MPIHVHPNSRKPCPTNQACSSKVVTKSKRVLLRAKGRFWGCGADMCRNTWRQLSALSTVVGKCSPRRLNVLQHLFRNITLQVVKLDSVTVHKFLLSLFYSKMLHAQKILNAVLKSTRSSLTCSSLYSSILRELLGENADDGNAIYEVWERAGAGQETSDNKGLSAISSGERFAILWA